MKIRGLFLRGKTYWLTFQHNGERHRFSLETSDLGEAKIAADRERTKILEPTKDAPPNARAWDLEIAAQADEMRREERSAVYVRDFVAWLTRFSRELQARGGVVPLAVTPAMAKAWQQDVEARAAAGKIAKRTGRAYIDVMHRFFRRLAPTASPFAGLGLPKARQVVRRRFLSRDEVADLLGAVEAAVRRDKHHAAKVWELRFILHAGLHAGLRREEVGEARWEWFDVRAKLVHVQGNPSWPSKEGDDRTIPLTKQFAALLAERKPWPGRGYVLEPKRVRGKARYRYDFRKVWLTVLDKSGIEHCTFHDLRRTFASQLVSAGVSIYKVAKWMGDDVDVVQKRYGHLVPQDPDINRAWK